MSETPRSDEDIGISEDFRGVWVVPVDIARQLETELAKSEKKIFAYKTALEQSESELVEARAEIGRKDKLLEQMRVALLWLYRWVKAEAEHFQANTPDDEIIKEVEAALSATERRRWEGNE